MNQNLIWFCFFLNIAKGWWWWSEDSKKQTDERDDVTAPGDYEYNYDDYYYSPLRRVGQSDDYYYYYADEYYPYLERQSNVNNGAINPLAAIVAPLAGLALIAAASAVSVNPMLMSIVTIRNRRQVDETKETEVGRQMKRGLRKVRLLERFLSSLPGRVSTADKLMLTYLECSELVSPDNHCLELMVCQYSQQANNLTQVSFSPDEKEVVSIVLYNLMSNSLVSNDVKKRLKSAAKIGRNLGQRGCSKFVCNIDQIL